VTRHAARMVRLATHAMATRFEFVLVGGEDRQLRCAGEEAIAIVQEWHARLNRFAPDSEISFLNRTAFERPVRVDRDWMELLRVCARVHELSEGTFDPAASSGVDGSIRHVRLDPESGTLRFEIPLRLDCGGIAKGFALDHVEVSLRAAGSGCALIHGGTSSVLAIGAPPDEDAWAVEVRGSGGDPLRVRLRDRHLSVSSPSGRIQLESDGPRGHIIDPRGGSRPRLDRTVAVLGPSGAECEAWSTAHAVLGDRPAAMPQEFTSAIHSAELGWSIEGNESHLFESTTALHPSESA
jgi:thiamine biosynthesis lipoprotein